VLDDASLAKALGDRGRLRAREFDWDRVTDALVEIYREAVRTAG
jgi:glycosyltransferase involved in cell wall biosynthesis